MKLKFITALIILMNILILSQDLPISVSLGATAMLFFSFFVNHKTARLVIKILLLFGSMYILRTEFKTLLVTECGVSFVIFLSSLKFWELDNENDHFNMFLILFLAECSLFLITPSFLIFFLGLLKMLFYFYYILKIRNYDIGLLNPKRLLILVTPSVVFALLLFYTFPRFTQGFMNSNDMQYLLSGGTSQMDFSQLGPINLSKDPVFKVNGLGESNLIPAFLYWKSSVFWQISNTKINTANTNLKNQFQTPINYKYKYSVTVAQSLKEYLPVLDSTSNVETSSLPFSRYDDGSFRLKSISRGNLEYSVQSNYGARIQNMNPLMERKALRLNSNRIQKISDIYNIPKTLEPSDEVRLSQLKESFKSRDFEYSTSPPAYNNIEDFILNGKKGYCTHFAFTFAYLARIYKIPSRVVMGYLGGEYNPYDQSILVRELDGHAWSEVYIKSKGWIRIDPTSFVAPERLKMSATDFNNSLEPYFSFLNISIAKSNFNFAVLNNAALWVNSLNSRLSGSMINFDREKQLQLLRSITPNKFPVGWVFVASLILCLALFSLIFYFLGRKRVDIYEKRYLKLLKKMKQLGLEKHNGETATQFIERCKVEIPNEKLYLDKELELYINSFYK